MVTQTYKVINEKITATSLKEFRRKLKDLGIKDSGTTKIIAEVFTVLREKAAS